MGRWRYWTEHPLTGEMLHPALPLSDVDFGRELNGPGHLSGTLAPKFVQANIDVLRPGRAVIYAEADGLLRWGGLVWSVEAEGSKYKVEAAGWSSYLTRRHDTHGNLDGRGPYTFGDPCTIIRDVWAYAQEQPDGDLGVVVDATGSGARAGTPEEPWASFTYETPVLGGLVDDLVREPGSPDYVCDQEYQANGTVRKRVRLGWPRLGARRTDISFRTGVNIVSAPPVSFDGDAYANVVIATGSGEGSATRYAVDPVRDGGLRMESVLSLPNVNGVDVLGRRAAAERRARQVMGAVESFTVRDHAAAPLVAWQIGDDVLVQVSNPWVSWSGWVRILSESYRPTEGDGDQATLTVARADAFHYGSAEEGGN